MSYHCPNCGQEVSFGESICPHCNEDVTSLWERMGQSKASKPKVAPGMGGMNKQNQPFPSPNGQPAPSFPPSGNQSAPPFPSPEKNESSPFPPANNQNLDPFPPTAQEESPFPPANEQKKANPFPTQDGSKPFPPSPQQESQPFPPSPQQENNPILEIPRINAKIIIKKTPFRIGRHEIQGAATKALPDLNAYKNISRKRENSEHFIIHEKDGQFLIEDIHSTNGTYLGTTKLGPGVPPQPLKDGDKIILPIEEFGKMVQLEVFFKKP